MVLATSQQEFSDADFRVVDNADQSKKLAFQVSGVAANTTRTWTVPDANVTVSAFAATLLDDTSQTAALTTLASAAVATFLLTPSSANFASLLTDETGTAGTVPFLSTGTWTPAFTSTGATFSYNNRSGVYRRVGDRVDIWCQMQLNTSGNTLTANTLTITGLPFTIGSGSAAVSPVVFFNVGTSYVNALVRTSSGTTLELVVLTAAAVNYQGVLSNTFCHATNGTFIQFNMTYFV